MQYLEDGTKPMDDDSSEAAPSLSYVEEAMAEIDRLLHQMLVLAEISAGDCSIDRNRLQKLLEHLQKQIDRIADTL